MSPQDETIPSGSGVVTDKLLWRLSLAKAGWLPGNLLGFLTLLRMLSAVINIVGANQIIRNGSETSSDSTILAFFWLFRSLSLPVFTIYPEYDSSSALTVTCLTLSCSLEFYLDIIF